LRCTSCHLDNGTRPNAMSWIGSAARYPRYRGRRGSEETLPQRINECIARSLAGRPLPEDGRSMRDMIAYLESLNTGARPLGPDTVSLAGDARSGRSVYTRECARCHGASGSGLIAPAVWGRRSYSIGAGLARQTVLATFVHLNMPHDRAGTLTAQQAADVAAFVLAQPRQDHPGKELDWPKGDPPADAAYATIAAKAAGKVMPAPRPLLPRRVKPTVPAASASRPPAVPMPLL
jgi:thiosulfate dehydrogenase